MCALEVISARTSLLPTGPILAIYFLRLWDSNNGSPLQSEIMISHMFKVATVIRKSKSVEGRNQAGPSLPGFCCREWKHRHMVCFNSIHFPKVCRWTWLLFEMFSLTLCPAHKWPTASRIGGLPLILCCRPAFFLEWRLEYLFKRKVEKGVQVHTIVSKDFKLEVSYHFANR